MDFEIVTLTRERMEGHLEELMEIDRGLLGEVWDRSHFLMDVPGKWEISQLALDEKGLAVGYIIGSLKEDAAHIHREAIAERCRRRQGLGMRLMGAAAAAGRTTRRRLWPSLGMRLMGAAATVAKRSGITHISVKVHVDNGPSQRMLRRLGWQETGREGTNYLMAVDVDTLIARASEK